MQLEKSGKFKEQEAIATSYIGQYPDSYLALWLFGSHGVYMESNEKN
jgi:hypothetical protein